MCKETLAVTDDAAEHVDSYVFVTDFNLQQRIRASWSNRLGRQREPSRRHRPRRRGRHRCSGDRRRGFAASILDDAIAHTTNHEARHTFRRDHTFGSAGDQDLLARSDDIRSGPGFSLDYRQYFSFFTRYTLNSVNGTQNSCNELANDPNFETQGKRRGVCHRHGRSRRRLRLRASTPRRANVLGATASNYRMQIVPSAPQ